MRRPLRLGVLVLATALALSLSIRAAQAEEPAIVTVVRGPSAGKLVEEATVRLAGELTALGFTVRFVEGTRGADGRAEVEGAGGALATIGILDTDRGTVADVWVADHLTKKTLVRRVDLGDPRVANAASDLAVRSTELLRASLLELLGDRTATLPPAVTHWIEESAPRRASPPDPPPAPTPPPAAPPVSTLAERHHAPPAPSSPAPPLPRSSAPAQPFGLGIEAGAALFASGSSVGPAALLRLEQALPLRLSLRASLFPSVAPARLEGAGGSASLRQTAATLDLAYDFLPRAARLRPSLALGGGFYHLALDGSAASPAHGLHEEHVTAGLSMAAGLGLRLAPSLVLRAELDLLVLASAPLVAVAGEDLGTLGRPTFLPSLGLDLGL